MAARGDLVDSRILLESDCGLREGGPRDRPEGIWDSSDDSSLKLNDTDHNVIITKGFRGGIGRHEPRESAR